MEEKQLKTSEAQRRASVKWKKNNYSRIPLDVRPEYHEYLKARAKADGMTLGAWIKSAIEFRLKLEDDEIPDDVIKNSIEWLQDHGHTDAEILDFLRSLSG